jgi:hypothetical protein
MATPSPNLLALSPSPSFPPLEEIVHSESALLKHVSRNYAHTSFETFTSAGYADFAYTVENMRWGASGQGDCTPLPRREMDRMWINVVMEFWVKMAWCWEADVEGIVIALLEVCFSSYHFFFFFIGLRWGVVADLVAERGWEGGGGDVGGEEDGVS